MVIRHLEQIGALGFEPLGLLLHLALWTVAITARIVRDLLVPADVASPKVPAEGRRAASDEIPQDASLL